MKTKNWFKILFGKELDMRVRLFNVLAVTGTIICIVMAVVSAAGHMPVSTVINVIAGAVSLSLLIYSVKKGHYEFCYMATIIVIFFILFPCLFLFGGGYKGGMPFFFVFAVVFTVYMLDGVKMLVMTAAELVYYGGFIVFACRHPDAIVPFASEEAVAADCIIGMVTVSVSLGATMFAQIRMYRKQQMALEDAQRQAQDASRAKSEFLASMSHEIRTPIHMILGMNELVLRESRGRQIGDYAEKIDEASKMLLSLVDSILDVSKIESGKMEVFPAEYDTEHLVSVLALMGKSQCERHHLTFSCHTAQDLPEKLLGDMPHIQQIAVNFLSNAAKYTESGGVVLDISCAPGREKEEILLKISVQDTGIGIRREVQPELFDVFARADSAAHRQIAGTGLGLAIAKKLTDLMGGTITVDSEPNKGSTFTVILPQKITAKGAIPTEEKKDSFRAPNVRMLAVDDNEGNRMVMRELLRPTEIQLDLAASGQECLQMTEEKPYDLILMDYMMPRMDGLQTMEILKSRDGFRTPVVALTADATPETRKKLLSGGFAACLTKPIPWEQLQNELVQLLPRDMVIPETEKISPRTEQHCLWENRLEPYGIRLSEGLRYFRNDLEEYCQVARVFLHHQEQERAEVEKLCQEDQCEQLRFHVHAMKGKAKNLGMVSMEKLCQYLETLCISDSVQEIRSLTPYLFYLWDRNREGITLLVESMPRPEEKQDRGDALEMLPKFLHELQRKPALDCISQLIAADDSPRGRELLQKVERFVRTISFEQAEIAFADYLNFRKEAESHEL